MQEGNHGLGYTCVMSGPQETPSSHTFIGAHGYVPTRCQINNGADMAEESGPKTDHSQADFYMPCIMDPGLVLDAGMIPWLCGPEQCGMVHSSGSMQGMALPVAQSSLPRVANTVETAAAGYVSVPTHDVPCVGAFLPDAMWLQN